VIAQLQLLFFSALAFTWLKLTGIYPPELRSVNIDVEWLYRRLVPRTLYTLGAMLAPVVTGVRRMVLASVCGLIGGVAGRDRGDGPLARSWSIGSFVLATALMLFAYLLIDLFG
jgi:multicomponent Na+:H+ antiporter subunit D